MKAPPAAEPDQSGKPPSNEGSELAALLPLVAFLVLAGAFAIGLLMQPRSVPSFPENAPVAIIQQAH